MKPRALVSAVCVVLAMLVAPFPGAYASDRPSCPNATLPPPAVDSSEVPPPGVPSPEPPAVPDPPIGGADMGACGVVHPPDAPSPPAKVSSATWLVAELGSGEVLAAKNPHGRHRPASVIKILTALVAARELDMSTELTATRQDEKIEGSSAGLKRGVTYTVRQVLTGLILQSGNDAAHALARKIGGTEATVRKMNRLAERLGAHDTHAATTSGLDGPGMSTSAYDLALISRAALREPELAPIFATRSATLPVGKHGKPVRVYSDSDVLRNYPGALAGKTGYTNDARHTRVVAAHRGGREIVAVLMRGEHRPIDLSEQAAALLDYGFRLGGERSVGELISPSSEPTSTRNARPAPTPARQTAGDDGRSLAPYRGSLVLVAVAGGAILAVLAVRRRRIRAALRDPSRPPGSDEHPR